jgi:hypothetical protein
MYYICRLRLNNRMIRLLLLAVTIFKEESSTNVRAVIFVVIFFQVEIDSNEIQH